MRHIAILIGVFFIFSAVSAETKSAKIIKSETLTASLIVTDHGTRMYQEWEKSPDFFPIWQIQKFERGKRNVIMVFIIDCTADENGYCNLTVSYKTYSPNGDLYGEYLNRPIRPFRGSKKIMTPFLSNAYMVLRIEPEDLRGEYRLLATVKDEISGEVVELEERAIVD